MKQRTCLYTGYREEDSLCQEALKLFLIVTHLHKAVYYIQSGKLEGYVCQYSTTTFCMSVHFTAVHFSPVTLVTLSKLNQWQGILMYFICECYLLVFLTTKSICSIVLYHIFGFFDSFTNVCHLWWRSLSTCGHIWMLYKEDFSWSLLEVVKLLRPTQHPGLCNHFKYRHDL